MSNLLIIDENLGKNQWKD